jgi:hypothetical protein
VDLRAGLDTEARRKILCLCRGSNPGRPVCSKTEKNSETVINYEVPQTVVFSSLLLFVSKLKTMKLDDFVTRHFFHPF